MTRITILILGLFISATLYSTPSPAPQQIYFKRFLEDQDISIGFVRVVFHDQAGFIWIGGQNGLYRFDGYQFKPIGHSESGNEFGEIIALYQTNINTLWVGTSSGLIKVDTRNDSFIRYHVGEPPINLPNRWVTAIEQSTSGELIFGTHLGLVIFNEKTQQASQIEYRPTVPMSNLEERIGSLFFDSHQNLWIGTHAGLTKLHWPSKSTSQFRHDKNDPNSLSDNYIHDVIEDNEGLIWIATSNGLNSYNPVTKVINRYNHDHNNPESVGANDVWELLIDSDGYFWAATDPGGLNLYDRKKQSLQSIPT